MLNKFGKLNKRFHDIDKLVIGGIAPVKRVGKTSNDIKYTLISSDVSYIIGYKDSKTILDLISEQEYPIITKCHYGYVDENSDKYFAGGTFKKLRVYVEQELKDKSVELCGDKKDLISLEDIKKVYNEINGIRPKTETKKDDSEISIGDYHYVALLKEISQTTKKINSNVKQKTKDSFLLQLAKLAEEYFEYIEDRQLPDGFNDEMEYRSNIIERLAGIEMKIVEANDKANLEKNCKGIVKSIRPDDAKRK